MVYNYFYGVLILAVAIVSKFVYGKGISWFLMIEPQTLIPSNLVPLILIYAPYVFSLISEFMPKQKFLISEFSRFKWFDLKKSKFFARELVIIVNKDLGWPTLQVSSSFSCSKLALQLAPFAESKSVTIGSPYSSSAILQHWRYSLKQGVPNGKTESIESITILSNFSEFRTFKFKRSLILL